MQLLGMNWSYSHQKIITDTFTVSQDYQGLDPSVNYFIFTNTISPNQDNSVLFKEFRGPRHSFRTKGVSF